MGKLSDFQIILDDNVFTAGNAINGKVTFELNRGMKIRDGEAYNQEKCGGLKAFGEFSRCQSSELGSECFVSVLVYQDSSGSPRGMRLNVEGYGKVCWQERHASGSGKNRRTITRNYMANDTYLDAEKSIFPLQTDQKSSGDNCILSEGKHRYPFSIPIPQDCPTSFESTYGRVRYCIIATIDKPWKFNHTMKKIFTVHNLLDLNNEPRAQEPLHAQAQKTICCFCCESGPITALLKLERAGYVPGECIPIKAEIQNGSNRTSDVYAELVMIVDYHSTTKTRTRYDILGTIAHGELGPGDTDQWNGDKLAIPALPPSFLRGCRIIDVKHIVQLKVNPSGPAMELEIPLEVIIGSIPLTEYSQQCSEMSYRPNSSHNALPDMSAATITQQPSTSSTTRAPIKYGQFVLGKRKVEHGDDDGMAGDESNFTPVYRYYDFKHKLKTENKLQVDGRHQAWR